MGEWRQPVSSLPPSIKIGRNYVLTSTSWGFSDFQGDGNGFKLGGGDAADKGPANHVITNCIAPMLSNETKHFLKTSYFLTQRR